MKRIKQIFSLGVLLTFLFGCGNDEATPKPLGYFRIETPEKVYTSLEHDCPYAFEYNKNAQWLPVKDKAKCWGDIYYKPIRARVQLTYKPLNGEDDLYTFLEDGRELAYKHVVKAEGIREQLFSYPEKEVHGIFYSIAGDAATSTQFVATDSSKHFLRGVVYFYASPNADSLKPVNDFMQDEMKHLIETLEWQN